MRRGRGEGKRLVAPAGHCCRWVDANVAKESLPRFVRPFGRTWTICRRKFRVDFLEYVSKEGANRHRFCGTVRLIESSSLRAWHYD